jgi:hypothetical protein
MHFLLLGATGRTGQHVLSTLLSQGHTATALVHPSSSLPAHPNLTTTTGSPFFKFELKTALSASLPPSAAIIIFNTVRQSDSPLAPQVSPLRFLADSGGSGRDLVQFKIAWYQSPMQTIEKAKEREHAHISYEENPHLARTLEDVADTTLPSQRTNRLHTPGPGLTKDEIRKNWPCSRRWAVWRSIQGCRRGLG